MKKILLIALILSGAFADVLNESKKANERARVSQQKIDKLDDKNRELTASYHQILKEIKTTKEYNDQLAKLIASQEDEKASINHEISSVDETARSLLPLINRMVNKLEEFVEIDLPFLLDERRARVERIKDLLNRADISISEKYRVVLEAYLIENEYSKTIESYLGAIDNKEVQFFRLGRVGLFYITLDFKNAFRYDETSKDFIKISSQDELAKAIKIAKKEILPDLITLPIKSAQ